LAKVLAKKELPKERKKYFELIRKDEDFDGLRAEPFYRDLLTTLEKT
jgi:hypothetical protein